MATRWPRCLRSPACHLAAGPLSQRLHRALLATSEQVGFAISVYQNSGHAPTNWADFEKRRGLLGALGFPPIRDGDQCGTSCDFWNLYEQDIRRAAGLGSNCFRLSLEWSRWVMCGRGRGGGGAR